MQLDKSTCQSYNLAPRIVGFLGRPSKRTADLLNEIGDEYNCVIKGIVQSTHTFDINACDALLHSSQKRKLRSYRAPLCREHIVRDFKQMVQEVSTPRMIQRCFWRAYRRDEEGEIDESLIPQGVLDWYGEEEENLEESDGDVEMDSEKDTDFEEESDYS